MLAYWDDVLSSMLAICSCLGTIKFLHILQFNSTIRTLFRTMSICASELLSFGIVFLISVFAFIQAGYVIFNDSILGLSTFFKSVETGFLLMLGKFQLEVMLLNNPVCSVIFYMTFNIFVIMVLLNLFISMMTDAFERAKEEEKSADPLGLENYLYEKMAKFFDSVKKEKNTLIKSPNKETLDREEQKTMASLGQHGMYMDRTQQFDFKATQLVSVVQLVK
jgi:polycystin 1L2